MPKEKTDYARAKDQTIQIFQDIMPWLLADQNQPPSPQEVYQLNIVGVKWAIFRLAQFRNPDKLITGLIAGDDKPMADLQFDLGHHFNIDQAKFLNRDGSWAYDAGTVISDLQILEKAMCELAVAKWRKPLTTKLARGIRHTVWIEWNPAALLDSNKFMGELVAEAEIDHLVLKQSDNPNPPSLSEMMTTRMKNSEQVHTKHVWTNYKVVESLPPKLLGWAHRAQWRVRSRAKDPFVMAANQYSLSELLRLATVLEHEQGYALLYRMGYSISQLSIASTESISWLPVPGNYDQNLARVISLMQQVQKVKSMVASVPEDGLVIDTTAHTRHVDLRNV